MDHEGAAPAPDFRRLFFKFRIVASMDEMMNGVETHQTNHDEIDGYHEVQDARHDENKDSRDQGNNRSNVGVGEKVHQYLLSWEPGT
jgi:hypothetical protein